MKVSLKAGVATIQFAPANRVAVSRIREAIRSNGFTAREAEVSVAGSLVQREDSLMLAVPGSEDVFVLQDAAGASGMVAQLRRAGPGARILVGGQIPKPGPRSERGSLRLLVRSIVAL